MATPQRRMVMCFLLPRPQGSFSLCMVLEILITLEDDATAQTTQQIALETTDLINNGDGSTGSENDNKNSEKAEEHASLDSNSLMDIVHINLSMCRLDLETQDTQEIYEGASVRVGGLPCEAWGGAMQAGLEMSKWWHSFRPLSQCVVALGSPQFW